MELVKNNEFTYYRKMSPNPNAKNIVFVHGFATTSHYHDAFINYVNKDYNYYAIQLPGHGVAPLENKKQLVPYEFAKYVTRWIESMKFENIYLIGHSMGGGIVLMVSTMIPNKIKKLIMVTPMNSSFSFKHLNILKFVPKNHKQTYNMEKIIIWQTERFYKDVNDPKIKQETQYQLKHRDNFKYLRRQMMSPKNMNHLSKAAKKNNLETLMILGKYDRIIDWRSAYKKFKKHPNYKIELFDKSAHLPFWEELDKYATTILNFIENK